MTRRLAGGRPDRRGGRFGAAAGGAPPSIPAEADLLGLYDARHGVTTSGGLVTVWADQSAAGNDLTAVASQEPAYNATGGPASQPAVVATGAESMTFGSAIRATSGPVTVMAVYDDTSPSDQLRYLIDALSGRVVVMQMDASGDVTVRSATVVPLAASQRGDQVVTMTLESGASGVVAYRGRASIGSGAYTERALAGTCRLLSDFNASGSFAHLALSWLAIWNRVLSSAELEQAWDYVDSIWGTAP